MRVYAWRISLSNAAFRLAFFSHSLFTMSCVYPRTSLISLEMDPEVFIGVGRRLTRALPKFNEGRIRFDSPFCFVCNMVPEECGGGRGPPTM